ncbi:MAG TPA: zf-HC2 domain-containing protein [Candidatus Limnocylindria bacterium]|nr:zf-HC2 domain-containing protein [Candidatus Limnocylindria bacterium]
MTEHPDLHLSAYVDEALAPAARAAVSAHLDGCARCRAQLADLRATSRLIGALPQLGPSRSLVPRLDRAPVWLRPVRLLGAMGSGLFVFLFLASAVINSGSSLGGGTTTAERLAEKGQFGAAVNALASDRAKGPATATPAPVPALAPAAQSTASGSSFDAVGRSAAASAAPTQASRGDAASTAGTLPASRDLAGQPFGPPPQLFLALAALSALAAFVAHRRLRRA